jgi:pimeloyl-ACP methyl ester carboxylesterase
MGRLFSRPVPDWADSGSAADFMAEGAEILGDDPEEARKVAVRIWERTQSSQQARESQRKQRSQRTQDSQSAAHEADQLGMVFSRLDCRPRWRERLNELSLPTLIVHGKQDPFFPIGNGEALARETPEARLIVLEDASTAVPARNIPEVAAVMAEL